jgi:hypothetical protein
MPAARQAALSRPAPAAGCAPCCAGPAPMATEPASSPRPSARRRQARAHEPNAAALPHLRRAQPEAALRRRCEQRRMMSLRRERAALQLRLKLAQGIGPPKAEWRAVASRPEAGRFGTMNSARPCIRQHPPGLFQHCARVLRSLQPVQHHQPVDDAVRQGPVASLRTGPRRWACPDGQGITPCWPGISPITRAPAPDAGP